MKTTTNQMKGQKRLMLWLVTPLVTGAVIMSLELAAFRLYAPYFGYSIYVWGSMISVVMFALASGYGLGGWFADRSKSDLPLYIIILASALYQLIIIYTARSLLSLLRELGDFAGPGLATLLIFTPPMVALAVAGPFVIRLLARTDRVGTAAGSVYALSTLGSIAGVLATTLFLIPRFGTQKSLLAACALSALTGLAGLISRVGVAALAIIPLAALGAAPGSLWTEGGTWVSESAYNLVRVVRENNRLLLVLNEERSVHTIRDPKNGWTGHYYDYYAAGPLLVPARRALILGMGAGGSIATTRETAPDLEIDAVEIDEKVIEAGRRFFDLGVEDERLRIHVADARPWLALCTESYDIVQLDLYQGGPYIPFYLATVEFFGQVQDHLSRDGLLMMNVFDMSRDRELLSALIATLKRVFPSVYFLPEGIGNYMVFAFAEHLFIESLRDKLDDTRGSEAVVRLSRNVARGIEDFNPPANTPVFTDDHAPIEEITRRTLAEY